MQVKMNNACQRTISGRLYLIQANSNTKRVKNETFSTLALRVIASTSGHLHKHSLPKRKCWTSNVNLLMPEEKKCFKINIRVG